MKSYNEPQLGNYKQIRIATDFYEYLQDSFDPNSKEWGYKRELLKEVIEEYSPELRAKAIELALKVAKTFILEIDLSQSSIAFIVFKNGKEIYKNAYEVSENKADFLVRKLLKS